MKKVYLDTMIFSFLVYKGKDQKAKTFSNITKFWFEEHRKDFSLFISERVLEELKTGYFVNKSKAIGVAESLVILAESEEIKKISEYYIKEKIMPETGFDAEHMAYASYYEMDYLLGWNYKHIVNANKFERIGKLNKKFGLKTPEIVDPIALKGA